MRKSAFLKRVTNSIGLEALKQLQRLPTGGKEDANVIFPRENTM
jgi:hypothetical protein